METCKKNDLQQITCLSVYTINAQTNEFKIITITRRVWESFFESKQKWAHGHSGENACERSNGGEQLSRYSTGTTRSGRLLNKKYALGGWVITHEFSWELSVQQIWDLPGCLVVENRFYWQTATNFRAKWEIFEKCPERKRQNFAQFLMMVRGRCKIS